MPLRCPKSARGLAHSKTWRSLEGLMKVLGLTGGVGMGKSTTAQLLRSRGVLLVDTDELARQVVEPGQPALAELAPVFGPEIIGSDGRLRRDELARRVFAD